MKKLTMNHLALSDLRANKKDVSLLAVGIFLAIFLTSASFLAILSLYQKQAQMRVQTYGKEDGFLFQAGLLDAQDLLDSGLVLQAGTIAQPESNLPSLVGTYDETASNLLNRQLLQGRLPQAAGEVALDETILAKEYPGATVGDTISITIQPRILPARTGEFTITGILQPQFSGTSRQVGLFQNALPQDTALPKILLCSGDPILEGLPQTHHLVYTYAKGATLEKLHAAFPNAALVELDDFGYARKPTEESENIWSSYSFTDLAFPVLSAGCALVLCAAIGILEAVGGQFARKEQQYRMLRAVGATQGQIRAISRRSSMLLALLTAPAAMVCAAALVWLCSLLLPEYLIFSWKSPFFPAAILTSFLLVWVCAELPALFACRKPILSEDPRPIHRNKPLPSRSRFAVPHLISLRKLRFRPMQLLGTSCLILILNLSLVFSAFATRILTDQSGYIDGDRPYFRIAATSAATELSMVTFPESGLTMDDVQELAALPHVATVTAQWGGSVNALVDSVGTYLLKGSSFNTHLWQYHPELSPEDYIPESQFPDWQETQTELVNAHNILEQILDTKKPSVCLQLAVVSDLSTVSQYLKEGQIDKTRLDSGEAILLCAPECYVSLSGAATFRTYTSPKSAYIPEEYDYLVENDQFAVGDSLPLAQIYPNSGTYREGLMPQLAFSTRTIATACIDGILTTLPWDSLTEPCVITTPEGLQSLGLRCDSVSQIRITLDGPVDRDTEEALRSSINRIAAREDGLTVTDPMSLRRAATERKALNAIFYYGLSVTILIISLILICGTRIREFRSQQYTTGVLRAMGCDIPTLSRLYTIQLLLCGLVGFLLALPGIPFAVSGTDPIDMQGIALYLAASMVSSAVVTLLCCCITGRKLRRILYKEVNASGF